MRLAWVRILVAGIVAEILYGLFLQFVVGDLAQAFAPVGMAGAVACLALGGLWVGRSASSRYVLKGALVGVVAVIFYFALVVALTPLAPPAAAQDETVPGLFSVLALANHALKIVGGALGGFLAARVFRRHAVIAS